MSGVRCPICDNDFSDMDHCEECGRGMSERNDGGPAFPVPENVAWDNSRNTAVAGLSMRDYFAAKAMQALIAGGHTSDPGGEEYGYVPSAAASRAYVYADAMLANREK